MSISDLDKKILFELDKDGRATFSDIARTLNTTPQVIKYHYEQLTDNKVIEKFWAFVDYDRAGYSFFWGYWFKFSGMTKEIEDAMYADLRSNMFIPILMRSDGYADVFLTIIAKDVFHHNEILQSIYKKYGKYITMTDLVVGLGFTKFLRTYLVNESNEDMTKAISGGAVGEAKLSELDRKIISILQVDGRMDFTKMAKKIGSSPNLVQKHYHSLCKSNVITKVTYTLNHSKLGTVYYRVLLKVSAISEEKTDALLAFCQTNKNIINYVKAMGSWQLMLDVEIESRQALRTLLRDMKYSFQDVIQQVEINEIYKIEKFTQMAIEYPEII